MSATDFVSDRAQWLLVSSQAGMVQAQVQVQQPTHPLGILLQQVHLVIVLKGSILGRRETGAEQQQQQPRKQQQRQQ